MVIAFEFWRMKIEYALSVYVAMGYTVNSHSKMAKVAQQALNYLGWGHVYQISNTSAVSCSLSQAVKHLTVGKGLDKDTQKTALKMHVCPCHNLYIYICICNF